MGSIHVVQPLLLPMLAAAVGADHRRVVRDGGGGEPGAGGVWGGEGRADRGGEERWLARGGVAGGDGECRGARGDCVRRRWMPR